MNIHKEIARQFDSVFRQPMPARPGLQPAAEALLLAAQDCMPMLGSVESNASGNPEFAVVGPRVARLRAAIQQMEKAL